MADRFSTATRLRALGTQAQAKVYRAAGRRTMRRSRLTGRAAVLGLVLCALVVALAYPTRQYVAQRSQIAEQRRQLAEAQGRVDRLREEKARWQDPEFAKAQAREHLHYVLPGESGYTVVSPPGSPDDDGGQRRASGDAGSYRPWYENFWNGVDHADAAARR